MAVIKQKIVPHLWFDREAKEATNFYCSVFPDSRITSITTLRDTPSGDCDVVSFTLWEYSFMAISAGPVFKFNEAVSLQVNCETQQEVDYYWEKLSQGGDPSAQQCGWLKDKYGLSWQVVPRILPELFKDSESPKAQRAMEAMLRMKKIDIRELERAAAEMTT